MCRLLTALFAVCVCLSALSVRGQEQRNGATRLHDGPRNPTNLPARDARQTNRNPISGEDIFSGLDPMTGNNNNNNNNNPYEYTSSQPDPYYPGGNGNQNFESQPDNGGGGGPTASAQPNRQTRPRPVTRPANDQWTTTSSTTPQSTTNSATLNSCNAECKTRIVMEYNPVCGSNEITYQNIRFMGCVADCSRQPITMSYVGKCAPVVSQ